MATTGRSSRSLPGDFDECFRKAGPTNLQIPDGMVRRQQAPQDIFAVHDSDLDPAGFPADSDDVGPGADLVFGQCRRAADLLAGNDGADLIDAAAGDET